MALIKTKQIYKKWSNTCRNTQNRRKSKNTKLLIIFISFILFEFSCKTGAPGDFFSNLNGSSINMEIGRDIYFVKAFGIGTESVIIANNDYRRLYNNDKSYFYLEGYLRNAGDSIMIIPVNYVLKDNKVKETKLFDFTLTRPASWKAIFKIDSKSSKGDSIIFLNKIIVKDDTLYNYSFTPFTLHNKINEFDYNTSKGPFDITVSKKNGIVSISKSDPISQDVMYEARFYPKQEFINNAKSLIEL